MPNYITHTSAEDVAHKTARLTGGFFFSPGARRHFEARIARAVTAPDGLLYVLHSAVRPGDGRVYRVTAFTTPSEDGLTTHHLTSWGTYRHAARWYERAIRVGITD